MTTDELIVNSTIRIVTKLDGTKIGTGTGFFFNFSVDAEKKTNVPAIVTNKHVIEGAINGRMRFNLADDKGDKIPDRFFDLSLNSFDKRWILHPDPSVDLCILLIGPILNELISKGTRLFFVSIDKSIIPNQDEYSLFSEIEDIIFIGYPDFIYDEVNNKPIVRKGITATSIKQNFNGKEVFLIDASVYGGSSGSPVFIFNQGTYTQKNNVMLGSRLKFIGVVSGVFKHFVNGEIQTKEIPTLSLIDQASYIPNNLGVAIHSQKILDFETIIADLLTKNSNRK